MTKHCETCQCDNPDLLVALNVRCHQVLERFHDSFTSTISPELAIRLSPHPRYQFGFRQFIPSASTNTVAGLFLAAIDVEPRSSARFFVAVIPSPEPVGSYVPRPLEYRIGDEFDIHGSPCREDLERILQMDDTALWDWLSASLFALRDLVERAVSGEPVAVT